MAEKASSPAVDRALTIFEILAASENGMTLSALAKEAAVPLATCASIMYTLEARGYAGRRVIGRSHFWYLTLSLYGVAVQLVRNTELSEVARSEMQEVADRLGLPVHIGVLEGRSVVYVAKANPPTFVQFGTFVGKVAAYNLTALGRAIAAYLPDSEIEPMLTDLSVGTGPGAKATVDAPEFLEVLHEVRKRGYAFEDQEEIADIACLAVPFFDASSRVAGAVGVTAFARDLTRPRRTDTVRELITLADTISVRLGYERHA